MFKSYFFLFLISIFLFNCKKENETIKSKQLSTSDNEIVNYVEYCNDRYDMCFDYPSNFGAQPMPINGDGRTFLNRPDSSKIVMYGFIDESGNEIKNQLSVIKEMLDNEKITEIENGYEIYGVLTENGHVYHEKLIIKKIENNMHSINGLQFTHPKKKTKKFQGYWETITEKFK